MKRFILSLLFVSPVFISAQEQYEVISTSRLNVRSLPTVKSKVLGTVQNGDTLDVWGTQGNWAVIRYKSRKAYTSLQYLRKCEKRQEVEEPQISTVYPTPVEEEQTEVYAVQTPGRISRAGRLGIDFGGEVRGGYTNFAWSDGSPKAGWGIGVNAFVQFSVREKLGFIPSKWFSELSVGYVKKGSGAFPLNYINIEVLPIGYRYGLSSSISIQAKVGLYVGYCLSNLETSRSSYSGNVDYGVSVGVGAEYKPFTLGISYERGFPDVCGSSLSLKNNAFFVTLSYKFLNLK